MKIFLTGATGRLGTHIIPHALSRGHSITALVRNPTSSADKLHKFGGGVTIIQGDLIDTDILRDNAKSHDAVIHSSAMLEPEVIQILAEALEGTGKVLIMSSGTAFLPPGGDEKTASLNMGTRSGTEGILLDLKDKGIRSIALRLAMNTHDSSSIHGFFTLLLGASDKLGYIPYIETNKWSACHSDDAGLLYILAMESAPPGTAVHALAELNTIKSIAVVLGEKTGKKVGEIPKDQMGELGMLAFLMGIDQEVSASWTKETFGWEPKGQGLLEEIEAAPKEYFGGGGSH